MPGGVILVFTRAPVAGKVKTRLIPKLGPAGAARLHAKLVHLTLRKVTEGKHDPVQLWCSPRRENLFFKQCRAAYGVSLHDQSGNDLGERMCNAFEQALLDYDWALMIGTDCPDLTSADLERARQIFAKGIDVVLGPAADGGYYLIGLKRSQPELFTNIPWGGPNVLSCTWTRLGALGLSGRELDQRHDLDRPDDLKRFPQLLI
tara:strand:+ start:151 stop:762 length:612 start_codon:yes stop_codon:yes gene_type:complete